MYRVILYVLVASLILCQSAGAQIGFPGGSGGASTTSANTWSGVQSFQDGKLRIGDSANDHWITIESNTNEAANYSLICPDLSASDTIMTLGASQQTVTGLKFFDGGAFALLDSGDDNNYNIQVPGNDSSNRILSIPTLTGNRTFAFIDEAQTISANHTFGNTNLLINDAGNDEPISIRPAEQSGSGYVLTIPDLGGTATLVTTGSANTFTGINDYGSFTLQVRDAGGDEPVGIGAVEQTGTGGRVQVPDLATNTRTMALTDFSQTFSGANTFTGSALFDTDALRVYDSAQDHYVQIQPVSDELANRTLTIPLLGANDTICTLGLAQTITGIKTMSAANLINCANTGLQIFDTAADHRVTIAPAGDEADHRVLSIPLLGGADTIMTLGTSQTVTGVKTMSGANVITMANTGCKIQDSDATHAVTLTPGNESGNRTLNIPVLGGTDTVMTLGAAQTVTGAKTFNANAAVFVGTTLFTNTAINIRDTGNDSNIIITPAGNEASNRTFNIPLMGGTGCAAATINVQSTDVNTAADTAETDAFSFTLPADVLSATGRVVKYTVHGSTGATGDTKTVKLYFGGTEVFSTGAVAANAKDWKLTLSIVDTGTNTQDIFVDGQFNATPVCSSTTQTKTDSSTNIIKTTLTNGAATANDITAKGSICTVQ